jgi:hypothetical protein
MRRNTRIVLIGAAIVVAFDVAASLLLQRVGGSLVWMFLGSGLIYLAVGFVSGRSGGIPDGARSGASVAALDGAVGWPITWVIGTGQVSRITVAGVVLVLVTMIAIGTAAGTAGAIAARLLPKRH